MKRKLGIVAGCLAGVPFTESLPMIRQAGFDTFFTGGHKLEDVDKIKNIAEKEGLLYESIHAPFSSINSMWTEGDDYLPVYNAMKESIENAGKCDIPIVVAHLSSSWRAPAINDLGLTRYDSLVEAAEKNNVIIAFENLRMVGNVAYFADRYRENKNVGFCYDCGHEYCYTKTVCWPDIFTDKIVYTHIHDNLGIDEKYQEGTDLHLLPFDGTLDYEKMMRKLDTYDYKGSLTLELNNKKYPDLSHEEFLSTCYDRIKKISEI